MMRLALHQPQHQRRLRNIIQPGSRPTTLIQMSSCNLHLHPQRLPQEMPGSGKLVRVHRRLIRPRRKFHDTGMATPRRGLIAAIGDGLHWLG